VLNLISASASDKSATDGIYGSVSAGANTQGNLRGGFFLNAQKGKWGFGANLNGGREKRTLNESISQSANELTVNTNTEIKNKAPMLFGEFSASYELDTLNLFSASLGLSRFGNDNTSSGLVEAANAASPLYSYDINSENKWKMMGITGSFDYQHRFDGSLDKMLTLSYRYSGEPSTSKDIFNYSNFSGIELDSRKQDKRDNSQEHTIQADYTTPLGENHELSTGLKYIYRHNSADDDYYLQSGQDWEYNNEGSSDYDYYNHIGAAYTEYSGNFGKFGLKAGLRYEHTWQHANFHDGSSDNFAAQYGNLVPNASLQWNIAPTQNIGLAYNMRIRRPGISYLNPFVNQTDPTHIRYGNPDISAEHRNQLTLSYNYFSQKWIVSAKIRGNYCGNGISEYSFARNGVLENTYGNIIKEYSLGNSIFVNWNASNKTRVYANLDYGYQKFESSTLSQENHGWNGSFMVGLQQTLPKDFRLSFNCFANTKNYTLQGYSGNLTGIAFASLAKSFFEDRLSLTLKLGTNLNKGPLNFEMYSAGKDFSYSTKIGIPIRAIGFDISYKFGKQGISVKKTKRSIENDDVINSSEGSSATTGTSGASTSTQL